MPERQYLLIESIMYMHGNCEINSKNGRITPRHLWADLLLDSILASAELQRNVPCLELRGRKVDGDEVSRGIKEEGVVSEDFL